MELYVCPFFMYHATINYPCITRGIFACVFTTLITIKLSLQCSPYNVPLPDKSSVSVTSLNNTMSLTYTRVESAVRVEGTGRMINVPQARMKIIAHSWYCSALFFFTSVWKLKIAWSLRKNNKTSVCMLSNQS